ncbi:MAG: DUF2071 domain-containing protein [Blastocatellia bacterium]|nr:DUF2071 domain-containing protein [Blastocatellia bacterium]
MTDLPKIFLTAEWRYLAMLNFAIEPEVLQPFVPAGTELDFWQGRTYVSVVGFLFLDTKVLGIPIPLHRNFEEVNLRFYVRHKGPEGWRRGVAFIKEIVPRFAITAVARWVYNENYVTHAMRHRIDREGLSLRENGKVRYEWKVQGRWNQMEVTTAGGPESMIPGSEAEFIAEHYWGYAAQKDGGCVEYRVEHPPWKVWRVADQTFDCDVETLYGQRFAPYLRKGPTSVFLAEGSEIIVRKGVRIEN